MGREMWREKFKDREGHAAARTAWAFPLLPRAVPSQRVRLGTN